MAHDPPLVVESRDLSPKENGYFFLKFSPLSSCPTLISHGVRLHRAALIRRLGLPVIWNK